MTSPLAETISLKSARFILSVSVTVKSLQVSLNDSKTMAEIYFEKPFQNKEIE